jgi:hypothetical protein
MEKNDKPFDAAVSAVIDSHRKLYNLLLAAFESHKSGALPPRRGHRHLLVAHPAPRFSSSTGIKRLYTLHPSPATPLEGSDD